MNSKLYKYILVGFTLFAFSCDKRNNYSNPTADIAVEFKINVETGNENHPVLSTPQATVMTLQLYNDYSTINYFVLLDPANKEGDFVKSVEIRYGDPNTVSGPLMAVLPGRYRQGSALGTVTGLRSSFIDSLLNKNIPKYVNIVTQKEPLGLARGQINSNIVLTAITPLTGSSVVPPVTTPTYGIGYLRLTADRTLYSRFTIYNDVLGDEVNEARLKLGTASQNGSDLLKLATSQLSNPKNFNLTESQYNQMLSSPFYINIASVLYPFPSGKLRGQVR